MSSFDGDLDDYQRYLLEESKRLREEARGGMPAPAVVQAGKTGGSGAAASPAEGSRGGVTGSGGTKPAGTRKKGPKTGSVAVGAR